MSTIDKIIPVSIALSSTKHYTKSQPKIGKNPPKQKRSTIKKCQNDKTMTRKDKKWTLWESSEQASRSERKLKKERFYFQSYIFEDRKKGFIVYDARRGLYSDELKDLEEKYQFRANKERKLRRHRKLDESLSWYK